VAGYIRSPKVYDGVINAVNFRLKRDGEGPAYRKLIQRSNLPFRQSEEHESKFNTREDIRTLFQTSWSDGAFWNKPLLSAASTRSYNTANGMDAFSVPGDLRPLGTVTTATDESAALYHPNTAIQVAGNIYCVADRGSFTGIRWWNGSAWANFTTNYNGADTNTPIVLFHDQDTNNLVQLAADGNVYEMSRGDSSDATIADIGSVYEGANAFMHFGRMFIYNGDILQEIADPYGSPAASTIYDDGLGADYLNNVSTSANVNDRLVQYARLAVATAEGIYIVKNVEQEGLPTAFVYRVDRTNDGTDIGTPIATLPPGMIALDVAYHLGSLLISASSDADIVMTNDLTDSRYPRIDLYHLTNGSLGSIGSLLGGDSPDEAPYRFAGTFGSKVYIGGQKRAWVYDAIQGGLHPMFEHFQSGQFGSCIGRAFTTTDASGDRVLRFFDSVMNYFDLELDNGVNDVVLHSIYSNYFDFNIPAESKTITHVTLMTDGLAANEAINVYLSADDESFSTAASFTSSDDNTQKKAVTGGATAGHRFRYGIGYTAASAVADPVTIKGIVFHAWQGEFVTSWQLVLDGKLFTNIENEPVDPNVFAANLEAAQTIKVPVAYIDEAKPTSTSHSVKLESIDVRRTNASELDSIVVTMTENT